MLLSEYINSGSVLDDKGVFDPILDKDSPFFINILRLKNAQTPEFRNSYSNINEYFRKIIKLLSKAQSKNNQDIFYRQALKLFNFSEVNGICLGFAESLSGAGFGSKLTEQVISTAYDIVKAGITDPEFFQLLPLFQDNIGPDRLSDMIATLILPEIKEYTIRINQECGITLSNYPGKEFRDGFLINPYKGNELLLLPVEILHKLPVAESWEEVDMVASENEAIRATMNGQVADVWEEWASTRKKEYLRDTLFTNHLAISRVLDAYRQTELGEFEPESQMVYLLARLEKRIANDFSGCMLPPQRNAQGSFTAAVNIIELFKTWVEYNKGWDVIQSSSTTNREKVVQRIIHLIGGIYLQRYNYDMSCEPDDGRGPVDFKISCGHDKTIIEVKLSTNGQYLHGYEVQVEEYAKAEQTDKMVYVFVDLGSPIKRKKLVDLYNRNVDEGKEMPHLIVVDAAKKHSASIS